MNTLSHAVDEASNHEDRVKVPQLLWVLLTSCPTPSKGKALPIPPVLNNPVQSQGQDSMKKNLCQECQKTQAAARSSRHLLVIFHSIAVPAESRRDKW